jgi:hypothetical protein
MTSGGKMRFLRFLRISRFFGGAFWAQKAPPKNKRPQKTQKPQKP